MHVIDDFQKKVGEIIHRIAAVGGHTADVDVRKVGVRAAFLSGDAHFRGRGMVVELDPPAFQEFFRRLLRQCSVFQVLREERIQVLIEVARVEGIPSVQLRDHSKVAEPIHL